MSGLCSVRHPHLPQRHWLTAPPFGKVSTATAGAPNPSQAAAKGPGGAWRGLCGSLGGPAPAPLPPGKLLTRRWETPAGDEGKADDGSKEGRDRQLAELREVPEVTRQGAARDSSAGVGWETEGHSLSYRQVWIAAVPV